jgi:predicted O-methyltransferase YrrM
VGVDERWLAVDDYFVRRLAPSDPALDAALAANAAANLPPHDVSAQQGRFLELTVRMTGAARVLEIGTLGGYSTIWMARALPAGGRIVTIEADPRHADVALANLQTAGVADRVDLRVGPALEVLPLIQAGRTGPFDLVFIDADKPSNPDYLAWALRLTRPGSVIIADNVVRGGAVADARSSDPSVLGVRSFVDLLADEPRLLATAMQTVGAKGWDGLAMAVVVAPGR